MNAVWEFEHSVECNANRAFVWAFWTDVSNWERIEGDAVESIRLDGSFAVGGQGWTKSPGQEPRGWRISQLDFERSATIEMPVDQCLFCNRMTFESLPSDRTRITQHLSIQGEVPPEMLAGIRSFERTAPEGLAKLASTIAAASQHAT